MRQSSSILGIIHSIAHTVHTVLLKGNPEKPVSEATQKPIRPTPLRVGHSWRREVVLATNVAETAVTIDDVACVIDLGRAKEASYDPYLNVPTLTTSWVSKASAQQRAGRAGRTRSGTCVHLYSRARCDALDDFRLPELSRVHAVFHSTGAAERPVGEPQTWTLLPYRTVPKMKCFASGGGPA